MESAWTLSSSRVVDYYAFSRKYRGEIASANDTVESIDAAAPARNTPRDRSSLLLGMVQGMSLRCKLGYINTTYRALFA